MLYDIRLRITYDYAAPAATGRHLLRLMPAEIPGLQRHQTGLVSVTPRPAERAERRDFFGNAVTEVVFREHHDEIVFGLAARVERLAEPPSLDISPDFGGLAREIAGYRALDASAPHHFLGPSPRIAPVSEITAYARDQIDPGATVFEAVQAVGLALHRDMTFDGEATTVDTTPPEAFAQRHGVCQDFAQIMIAGLRGVGIPAGYVSGFLRTIAPKGRPRLEGADAMHAWVQAWCGREAGWVEFDPTNATIVGVDHVVAARGRDYGDVAPVMGILRIAGGQKTDHAVDVIPLGPQEASARAL